MDSILNPRREVSYCAVCLGGITKNMQSILYGVSCKLLWRKGMRQRHVGQLREFPLPISPSLENVWREIRVIPASLLGPQLLDKDLGPCHVWNTDPKRIVLVSENFI